MAALSVVSCSDDDDDGAGGAGAATSSTASSASTGGSEQGGMGGEADGGEPAVGGGGAGQGGAQVGGAGGGVGGDTGYDGVACLNCVDPLLSGGACAAELDACEADGFCLDWEDCITDCFQPNAQAGCWDACDAAHPDAAELYADIYDCVCPDCAAICGTACN